MIFWQGVGSYFLVGISQFVWIMIIPTANNLLLDVNTRRMALGVCLFFWPINFIHWIYWHLGGKNRIAQQPKHQEEET